MEYLKYVKLREDKSNLEEVLESYLPAVKRMIVTLGIEETEDLIQECSLGIIEVLNKSSVYKTRITQIILTNTAYIIKNYLFRSFTLSGFEKTGRITLEKIRLLIESINSQDEKAIIPIFNDDIKSSYILMEQAPYQDCIDYSESDLETDVINKCTIEELLQYLTPKEREIIMLNFGFYGRVYSIEEIGALYNTSKTNICNFKTRALAKLKKYFSKIEEEVEKIR